jgi:hypothetical protein
MKDYIKYTIKETRELLYNFSVAECARWVPSLVSEQQVLYILLVFPVELRSLDKYNDHQKAMSPICIPDMSYSLNTLLLYESIKGQESL